MSPAPDPDDTSVLLVPDVHRTRAALRRGLTGRGAVIGPSRHWTDAAVSYRRVLRALELVPAPPGEALDADEHLVEIVLRADPAALADLRVQVLAPLADLRPATAERLAETLSSWLLHQGRREAVAAHLHIHPQTVRYRMTQLRELFGDTLTDPRSVLQLTIALAVAPPPD